MSKCHQIFIAKCAFGSKATSSPRLPQVNGSGVVFCSKESGNGSGGRKKGLVLGLVRACREKETKYIVRTLVSLKRHTARFRINYNFVGSVFPLC